jgi:hypothetical protein
MATLHKESDLLERIIVECEDDYVGLWSVYRQLKEAQLPYPRHSTLALVYFLLSTGVVEAGFPDAHGGFHSWTLAPEEAYLEIANAWSKLGREPDVGDIVWFTKTDDAALRNNP